LYLASRSSLAFWLITGDGILASVSVFETKDRAEESNRMAARWVKRAYQVLVRFRKRQTISATASNRNTGAAP
jgi:hypothetical protein